MIATSTICGHLHGILKEALENDVEVVAVVLSLGYDLPSDGESGMTKYAK